MFNLNLREIVIIILIVNVSYVRSIFNKQRYGYKVPPAYLLLEKPQLNYYNHRINNNHYNGNNGNGDIFNYKILYDQKNNIIKDTVIEDFNGIKKPKSTTKYLKHTSGSKLKSSFKIEDADKNCCGNKWLYIIDKIRDYSSPYYNNNNNNYIQQQQQQQEQFYDTPHVIPYVITNTNGGQLYSYRYKEDDIKPVVEHIEDDLKYDFRTNTHSF